MLLRIPGMRETLVVGVGFTPHSRILSATVRDNILFSHTYDESFYDLVIEGPYFYIRYEWLFH